MDRKLPLIDGVMQGVGQLQRAYRILLHLQREELVIVAAALLGPVHGDVGRLQQVVEILAVFRVKRDADGRRDVDFVVLHAIRFTDRAHDLFRYMRGTFGAGVEQQQHEFVTTQPRHRVLLAHQLQQTL